MNQPTIKTDWGHVAIKGIKAGVELSGEDDGKIILQVELENADFRGSRRRGQRQPEISARDNSSAFASCTNSRARSAFTTFALGGR